MKREIICTVCPRGCHIMVEGEGDNITDVKGNSCQRGKTYAVAEFAHPVRILTTTVKLVGANEALLPVRSSKPLPKEKLMDCMQIIRQTEICKPIQQYDIIISNILDTGVDIIASAASAG